MTTSLRPSRSAELRWTLGSIAIVACIILGGLLQKAAAQEVGRFPESALRSGAFAPESKPAPAAVAQAHFHSKSPEAPQPQIFAAETFHPSLAHRFARTDLPLLLLGHSDPFTHCDPDDPARHIGLGQPLIGTSWLNRPYYTSVLFGGMLGDVAIAEIGELENGWTASIQQGYDFDHYFGGEIRLAAAQLDVADSPTGQTDDLLLMDARLLFYPWGDALWRPYYSLGIGFAQHSLVDNLGIDHGETLVNVPVGVGLKYQWKRCCALRFDVTHNINFGSGVFESMDNISFGAGAEWRYGVAPKSYYPWHPGTHHH